MNDNNLQRDGIIGWMDYAKTLAIFSVVLLHTHCDGNLTVTINGYVMPLFFFLSGFLFSRQRNPDYGTFVYKRFRQLVIPYLWINAVAYVAWLVALRHFGDDAGSATAWYEPLSAVALGVPPALVHDVPVWSLFCFFVVEVVYYPLHRFVHVPDLVIAVCAYGVAAVFSITAPSDGWSLPLTAAPVTAGLAYYSLGHWVKDNRERLSLLFRPSPAMLLLGAVLVAFGVEMNDPTQFYIGLLSNPVWFLTESIGGILFFMQVSLFLSRIWFDPRWVRFISRGTLIICGFHLLIFAMVKGVALYGLHIAPAAITDGILPGAMTACVVAALCCPVVYIVHRWLRPLVDK